MPIEVIERASARRLSAKSAERSYLIRGATTEIEARATLLSSGEVPTSVNGLERDDNDCSVEEMTDTLYLGTAMYRSADTQSDQSKPVNTFTVSVDVSGQSMTIRQAYKTIGNYAASGKKARDFKGGINVTDSGVEGTEIIIPAINYTLSGSVDSSMVDDDYVRMVADIVGCQNKRRFRTWDAGELLLTRVSGNQRGDGTTELQYGFGASRNATNLKITGADGVINVPKKRGWDYLWCYYEEREVTDDTFKHISRMPVSAHVAQVYRDADFDSLGI